MKSLGLRGGRCLPGQSQPGVSFVDTVSISLVPIFDADRKTVGY